MPDRIARLSLLAAGMGTLFLLAACKHFGSGPPPAEETFLAQDCAACAAGDDCPGHAKVCKKPTVMALAHDLDHLEKHIDWYGSAVAKVPDVWGQARLTQYREDFEQEMSKNLTTFEPTLQGSLARTDQAFFTQAAALSAAAAPPVLAPQASTTTVIDRTETAGVSNETLIKAIDKLASAQSAGQTGNSQSRDASLSTDATAKQTSGVTGTVNEKTTIQPPTVKAAEAEKASGLITAPQFSTTTAATSVKFGVSTLSLEPTLALAQKARYLDYLAQLRRTNEGSDTADAPGYSLNLMRVPVSVFPGKKTESGYGAEITFTVDPVLGEDLLPMTFRNLVVNDLLHQLGYPLTQFLNDRATVDETLTPTAKLVVEGLGFLNAVNRLIRKATSEDVAALDVHNYLVRLLPGDRVRLKAVADQLPDNRKAALHKLIDGAEKTLEPLTPAQREALVQSDAPVAASANPVAAIHEYTQGLNKAEERARDSRPQQRGTALGDPGLNTPSLQEFEFKVGVPALSHSPGLVNKTGFPTAQLMDVYGLNGMFEIAYAANQALQDSITRQKYAHLPDVQAFLQQEAMGAYRFLREPEAQPLWDRFCTQELVTAVRTRRVGELQTLREEYRRMIDQITQTTDADRRERPYNEPGRFMVTAALAWCIIVDSALLTDRLIQDMKETASAKGGALVDCGAWLDYYRPEPSPAARSAFNAYVKVRWPIYVFALDPATQDQNLADALSTRREMQLAMALAFTNGLISANTMTRYARRLEAEYQTIALNRTQVGFAHGENVFGWRFYPRFQSPDTPSNLTTLVRDQLIGGPNRDQLLRDRRLEPGPRDCVALVIMPSFVPYVTVDAVSNWFALANPKHKVLDHTQAVRLSRTVRTLQKCECAITDADCYRDGELRRMQARVEQLGSRLPTQTMTFPVPILNTLGGFEMFSNGTTDLAPELYGWYGAPGVSLKKTTTLFLVGDHFSPLRSRVIVGNSRVAAGTDVAATGGPPTQRLLSRQVMQVTIAPDAVIPVKGPDGALYAQTHVATPYGVTRELLIPVVDGPAPAAAPAPKSAYTVAEGATLTVSYGMLPAAGSPGWFLPVCQGVAPTKFKLLWTHPTGVVPATVQVQLVFPFGVQKLTVPCSCSVAAAANGDNEVVFTKETMTAIGCELLRQIRDRGPLSLADNPLTKQFATTEVRVTPVADGELLASATVAANGQFTVAFQGEGHCPEKVTEGTAICPPKAADPVTPVAPPAAAPAGSAYTFPAGSALEITYGMKPDDPNKPSAYVPVVQGAAPKEVPFEWFDPVGAAPANARVRLEFQVGNQTITVPCGCTLNAAADKGGKKEFVLGPKDVEVIACELVRQLRPRGALTADGSTLPSPLVTSAIWVTPIVGGKDQVTSAVPANGQLAVTFKAVGYCKPDADKFECKPCGEPAAKPKAGTSAAPPAVAPRAVAAPVSPPAPPAPAVGSPRIPSPLPAPAPVPPPSASPK